MAALAATPSALTADSRNEMILRCQQLVKVIARRYVAKLPPNVEREELEQVAWVRLLDSWDRFDASKGAFEAFARANIHGAMGDYLREIDHVPRSVRRNARELNEARATLARELGREPTDAEMASHLDTTVKGLETRVRRAEIKRKVSLDAPTTEDGGALLVDSIGRDEANAEEDLLDRELKQRLAHHVANLPEKQRLAINLYYMQGMKLREVGELLGVTESRACQLTRQAQKWLHGRLSRVDA